jgi:CubicO group peptidase (beta-lactamase class C family)
LRPGPGIAAALARAGLLVGLAAALPDLGAAGIREAAQAVVTVRFVAGAVIVAGDGERILGTACSGDADIASRRPMAPDTLFWVASMSKAVTGTAVMMLVDEGKVGLDDPVSRYLPAFASQKLAVPDGHGGTRLAVLGDPIRIRDLLTHTSGLTPLAPQEAHIDHLSLADNVGLYPLLPLRFPRATRYEYSNAGINTAGRIVEVVSGMPFARFLDERLFTPLGMKDTTFWPDRARLARLATSYKPSADERTLVATPISQLSYPLDDRRRGACPAGGLFSTAGDMYRFARMVYHRGAWGGHRYVSEASVDLMTTTETGELQVVPGKPAWGYGFGWLIHRRGEREDDPVSAGSFGAGGAYNTGLWINRSRRLITVWMVQQEGFTESDRNRLRTTITDAAVAQFGR